MIAEVSWALIVKASLLDTAEDKSWSTRLIDVFCNEGN